MNPQEHTDTTTGDESKMDKRLVNILKRMGLHPSHYWPVFEKCKDFTALHGEEYRIANTLTEFGLMSVLRTPIFSNNNTYSGVKVEFKSLFEKK